MSENVVFEGMLRIEGTLRVVEKTLADIHKKSGVVIDRSHDLVNIPDITEPGGMEPITMSALLSDPAFVMKRVNSIKRKAKRGEKLSATWLPDFGIAGGRKYAHLHVGDKLLALNKPLLNKLVLDASAELNRLGAAHQIGIK